MLLTIALDAAALVWLYMTAWFFAAWRLRRYDVADVAWGIGFATIAWWGLISVVEPGDARMLLVVGLVTAWAVRLAAHVSMRNFAPGHPEDVRYATWRREWGRWSDARAYLQVFLLQGALMWLVSSPILVVIAWGRGPLGLLDLAGASVWAIGLAFEMVGDRQLAAHLSVKENRGRPLTTGLWGWTRHPNYFGDAVAWWGIGMIGVAAGGGWIALVGPALMTLLLRFVSGVPLLEKRHQGEPEWEEYRRRVGVFVPWRRG